VHLVGFTIYISLVLSSMYVNKCPVIGAEIILSLHKYNFIAECMVTLIVNITRYGSRNFESRCITQFNKLEFSNVIATLTEMFFNLTEGFLTLTQVFLTLTEVFPWLFSVVRQMPGKNSQRRCTARTLPY
jgi:hypothetical protein